MLWDWFLHKTTPHRLKTATTLRDFRRVPVNAALARRTEFLKRLVRDRRGAAIVLFAIALPVLIGFTALGVETGLWYAIKRQDQSAADAAALSGAYERAAGQSYANICDKVRIAAAANGFPFQSYACPTATPGCTNPASGTMCANNPPISGVSTGDDTAVEVILDRQQNTLLAHLFRDNVSIGTRAVAKVLDGGIACAGALHPTAAKAVNFSGSSSADFSDCGLFSNSNAANSFNFQGNTSLTAGWFEAVGGYDTNGNSLTLNVPTKLTYGAAVTDPYTCSPPTMGCAGTISYTLPAASAKLTFATGGTLQPGLYVSASNKAPMDFTNSGTTYLCPGVLLPRWQCQ